MKVDSSKYGILEPKGTISEQLRYFVDQRIGLIIGVTILINEE